MVRIILFSENIKPNLIVKFEWSEFMSKPSIFFSHSSTDREQLLELKKLLAKYTGGTLDIFMSSDGESIPFGRNWVHKIEEGLNSASIMFVFVTPSSVNSNWIYFEAGYAYSKDVEVIPVALGIEIGLLKAPLSLLQGFNLVSADSLNNFITIINRKFDFAFEEKFTHDDFLLLSSNSNQESYSFGLSDVFSKVKFTVYTKYKKNDDTVDRDLQKVYLNIVKKLEDLNLKYSSSETRGKKTILVAGIKILYKFSEHKNAQGDVDKSKDKIDFKISTYNFSDSINILNELFTCLDGKDSCYLWFSHTPKYQYITDDEDISSLLYTDSELQPSPDPNPDVHSYKSAKFAIFEIGNVNRTENENVLSVIFEDSSFNLTVFYELIQYLIGKKIINEIS